MSQEREISILMVRHGETEDNLQKIQSGWRNTPLTPKGIEQSKIVGRRLRGTRFANQIFSSDLERANDTAAYIAKELGMKTDTMNLDCDLRESSWGEGEGLPKEQINEIRKNLPAGARPFPHAETVHEVEIRTRRALRKIGTQRILDSSDDPRNITLAVASRGPIRSILRHVAPELVDTFPNCGGLLLRTNGVDIELDAVIDFDTKAA